MGTGTVVSLTREQAQTELNDIKSVIGDLDNARARSYAGVLSDDDEQRFRRAEQLTWLLEDR